MGVHSKCFICSRQKFLRSRSHWPNDARQVLSTFMGALGSTTTSAMDASTQFLSLGCLLYAEVLQRADLPSRESYLMSVRSIFGRGPKAKFMKEEDMLNAWQQNSNSQHREYTSLILDTILSQFHPHPSPQPISLIYTYYMTNSLVAKR
jgi:hypothetical protein